MESKKNQMEAGWTVVELLLTLIILSCLLLLAVPAVSEMGKRVEQALLLDLLSSDIQLAQMEALSRQKEVKIEFSPDMLQIVQEKRYLHRTKLPANYRIQTNFPNQSLYFRETGQAVGGTIRLLQGEIMVGKIIVQVASGRPKVELEWK
ncbi:GspH/FimT family pseudopilin [Thermoflavimicrobium dichotomicum]|uniref:General secretion pathway GspH domain-containing protein n=1 Tax=Thermoflavimicrobium dichotomicum TaxID=46223 RepID=A0A1I3NEL0_9BACL|nr:GspH/FimT family pseudopilin [Thermoflavimicrobium dichotomicum]SFJ07216.1 hypothetical protein SAMN05421852_10496 [Thermoflavimicrobium dichotomicum]